MSAPEHDYEFRTFPAAAPDGKADDQTRGWLEADSLGFHEPRQTAAALDRWATSQAADGQQLTGVYTAHAQTAGLHPDLPVATFASFERTINVGGDEPLPAHLISSVTVRPTHRRRGILRRMMTADLEKAHADGYALAGLTATEATIYRRFGFGVATSVHAVAVTTDYRFALAAEPAGHCELIDPKELVTVGPAVFEGFHRAHPGSVDRHDQLWTTVSGIVGENGDEDRKVRAAAHYDESGAIDGYVSYRFGGWAAKPWTLEVVDLVAQNDDAYLGLWEFLASVDLAERVTYEAAPVDDPLRWALTDWRVVKVTSVDDWLWLRVLDVVRAFEARGYVNDGEVVFGVTDALGYAEGRYRLRVTDGRAAVTREDSGSGAVDVELDVWALSTLYLGAVDPSVLKSAGQLVERTPGAVARLRSLLQPVAPVYGITHF